MATGLSKKMEKKVADAIFEGVLQHSISTGAFDPRGRTAEEIHAYGLDIMTRFVSGEAELTMIADHTRGLLSRARNEAKSGSLQWAVFYYATWAEHTLNKWISNVAGGSHEALSTLLIRETAIRAKFAWVCIAMGKRQPSSVHIIRLQRLSDARNNFVHYKWKGDGYGSSRSKELIALLDEAEKLVSALKKFEAVHFMKGASRTVSKLKKLGHVRRQGNSSS